MWVLIVFSLLQGPTSGVTQALRVDFATKDKCDNAAFIIMNDKLLTGSVTVHCAEK